MKLFWKQFTATVCLMVTMFAVFGSIFLQTSFQIMLEREKERKAEQEMIHGDTRCRCSFSPIFADMEDGRGVACGVMEVQIPAKADPEDIIKAVIDKLYGAE